MAKKSQKSEVKKETVAVAEAPAAAPPVKKESWFKPSAKRGNFWHSERPDIDENTRKIIAWMFETTKYAFLAGAVKLAAQSTGNKFLFALGVILSAALLLHIQMTMMSLELRVFNEYGVKKFGFWANGLITICFAGATFYLLNVATNIIINQAIVRSGGH